VAELKALTLTLHFDYTREVEKYGNSKYVYNFIAFNGDELYVLVEHHKMCKLANWSHPSNTTSCSHAPGHATEEQAKQPNIHRRGMSST
jgi:hypothetical protein